MKFLRNQKQKEQASAQKLCTLPQIWHELANQCKRLHETSWVSWCQTLVMLCPCTVKLLGPISVCAVSLESC